MHNLLIAVAIILLQGKLEAFYLNAEKHFRPFGTRDKVGYLFGDLGNDFFFMLASSFLTVFYTKVLGVEGAVVGTLFLVARCVDAVTDLTMGRIVDRAKPGKDGRFRPWIRRMCIPVVLSGVLMFIPAAASLPMGWKLVYIYATYLLWGSFCYTGINIPYGSMASVLTEDPVERSSLSTFRSVGAAIASVAVTFVVPLIIYETGDSGAQIVMGDRFLPLAIVFAVLALVCYLLCYRMTTERVHLRKQSGKNERLGPALMRIAHNRALLAIIAAAIILLLSMLLVQNFNNFLFADYFNNKMALAAAGLLGTASTLLLAPFAGLLIARYGKRECSIVALLFAAAAYFVVFLMRVQNPWIFCVFSFLGGLGVGLFNLMVWAFITDIIDAQEVRSGVREDGTIYAVYSFARKIGQALAGGLGGYALQFIGYQSSALGENIVQAPEVVQRIYTVSTIVPAVSYFLVALVLLFWYPLTKRIVEENGKILKEKRAAEHASQQNDE